MSQTRRILLVSTNRHRDPYPVYPLGVSYLKSYLGRRLPDYEVVLFDCNLGTNEQLQDTIRELQPRYVGLSFRNVDGANSLRKGNFLPEYQAIAQAVRQATAVPLLIGGSGFSIFPQHFMEITGADYGLAGEGEESLARLIETLDAHKEPTDIDGLFIQGHEVKEYPQAHRCYLHSIELEFEESWIDYYWRESGMLNIQTKRGCPYNCVYCSYPVIDGRKIRTLEPQRIVEDIIRLKKNKGIDYLFFTDSVFNICREFNMQLAEELIRAEAGIRWGAYFSPGNLTSEELALYRRSGLTHIEFGTESFDDEVLAAYGKRFTFDDVVHASEAALAENIYYAHFLILGGIGETMASVERSIANSRHIRYSVFFPYIGMRIYPHTSLQQLAVKQGIIDANDSLVEPRYWICSDFDLERTRKMALATGKSWVFPDNENDALMYKLRVKHNKKGPLWEYLRKA